MTRRLADGTRVYNISLKIMLEQGWIPGNCLGKGNHNLRCPISLPGQTNKFGIGYKKGKGEEEEELRSFVSRVSNYLGSNEKFLPDVDTDVGLKPDLGFSSIFEDHEYVEDGSVGRDLPTLPEITVLINGIAIQCLIDTGSQVTAIAKEALNEIETHGVKFPIVPIASLTLKGAIGQRSARINQLILLPLTVDGYEINTPCLVVEKLIRPIILGYNWLEDNRVTIDCASRPTLKIGTLNNKVVNINDSDIACSSCLTSNVLAKVNQPLVVPLSSKEITRNDIVEYVKSLDLNQREKIALEAVLIKRKAVFSKNPGCTHVYEHKIRMLDETPFTKYPYPVPFAYRNKVEDKIRELEQLGIIKRAPTPYASPLTYTLKKDGSVRILLDARELNTRIEGETEKPPVISEILQQFHGVKFISTLDLNNAYFQIKLHKDSIKYTGFVFNNKSYVYLRLPQGLKTSVSGFTRAMDKILGLEVREFCANYLDDVCCYSRGSLEDHMTHLDKVLERFELAGFTCNLSKCNFLLRRVKMLGHIISPEGIEMDGEKLEAIKGFPVPKRVKHLRAFLGLCNYYRRFINKYGHVVKPLCELLKKGIRWHWGLEQQSLFEKVKDLFIESVILKYPDPSKTYYLQTDSSGYAVGGYLYQLDCNGDHQVIGFCSKGLTEAERRWTVSEQEMWAVIYCLKKFECYLRGVKVVIRTDHHSLTFLRTWKMHCNRVVRWLVFLNQFDYSVEYIPGKDNTAADILSRYSNDAKLVQEDRKPMPEIAVFLTENEKRLKKYLHSIAEHQKRDKELCVIIKKLLERPEDKVFVRRGIGTYELNNGILYVTANGIRKLVAPDEIVDELIWQYHKELGHSGSYKIIRILNDKYFWFALKKRTKALLRTCHECQLAKVNNCNTVGPCTPVIAQAIGEKVMADLYGPLPTGRAGCHFVFVLQDSMSKFVKLYALRRGTAKAVLGCVKKFCEFIEPKCIITDHGRQFTSKVWINGLKELDIQATHISVYNPRPNSTERFHRELGNMLRIYCHESHSRWTHILRDIEECHNSTVHLSNGYAPNFLMYGKHYTSPIENKHLLNAHSSESLQEARDKAVENLKISANQRKRKFDANHRLISYSIGQLVKLKAHPKSDASRGEAAKLFWKYDGPYLIGSIPYQNTYTLVHPTTKKILGNYNAFNIEKYYANYK